MIENSSAGLHMFEPAVPVTVTREEHHQHILARYPVHGDVPRRVAVELAWCTIGSGKYEGQQAIEVRLDGSRVGELTYAMSQRYAPFLRSVSARGARPGCEALVHLGKRGIELELYLPRHTDGVPVAPMTRTMPPVPAGPVRPMDPVSHAVPPMRAPVPSKAKSNHGAGFVVAGVVGVITLIAVIAGSGEDAPTASDTVLTTTTTSSTTTTTTTTTPPPTTPEIAPPPVTTEAAPPPAAPTKAPVTTTKRTTTVAPAPPKPAPTTAASNCDENYSGCVPVASDVDCAGGSGNGPAYVRGPVRVIGSDIYDLDRDGDGVACE
ncbi:excalibur calcium-binding domain-containing protein [Actinokineospora xionganensis]|uniref:excalibur calcium-binding domain-containing protein n=1 Tax=Actinokineospora xionganensis TaxID=2684470 RepID=UPI001C9C01B5|nr:excalibur calcium-binding domain-containing protein [Actinokineospora xionganensis]